MAEVNSNISDLEHKLKLMLQLLQTTEGSVPIIKAKLIDAKERPPSEEEDTKSIAQTPIVEASEGMDDAKTRVSASSVVAMVDEEEPAAILADESHAELDEEELLDEEKKDYDLEEESKEQEMEEAVELEAAATEERESTEVVGDEQILSSEEMSKPKTETAKAQAVMPSSHQGASSQVVHKKSTAPIALNFCQTFMML